MRRRVLVLLVAGFVAAASWGAGPAGDSSAGKKNKPITVSGEVLDLSCYLARGLHGPLHRDCAKQCILSGVPMGLMTADSTLYLLTQNHGRAMTPASFAGTPDMYAQCREWAALQVEVNGATGFRNGVRVLEVTRAKLLPAPTPVKNVP
jgi:hypothetical protein